MTGHAIKLTFTFDRSFLWRALWRDHAWHLLYTVGVFAVLMLVVAWAFGAKTWLVGIPLGVAILPLVFFLRLRISVYRTYELWRKQSPSHTIRYLADADGLTVELDHAQSRHAWTSFRRLWRYPDIWMLEVVRNQSVLFPPREASEAMKAFIVDCCRGEGVRT